MTIWTSAARCRCYTWCSPLSRRVVPLDPSASVDLPLDSRPLGLTRFRQKTMPQLSSPLKTQRAQRTCVRGERSDNAIRSPAQKARVQPKNTLPERVAQTELAEVHQLSAPNPSRGYEIRSPLPMKSLTPWIAANTPRAPAEPLHHAGLGSPRTERARRADRVPTSIVSAHPSMKAIAAPSALHVRNDAELGEPIHVSVVVEPHPPSATRTRARSPSAPTAAWPMFHPPPTAGHQVTCSSWTPPPTP
jgi:hypothetical protein